MIDNGEALLATVGLLHVVRGDSVSDKEIGAAIDIESRLRELLAAYLAGKRKPAAPAKDEDLPVELSPDAHGAVEGLAPELAVGYVAAASRALAYLRDLVPPRALPGLRAREATRSEGERGLRRRALTAIDRPLDVLGDLDALTDDHVAAMRAVYPTIWGSIPLLAAEAMAEADRDLTQREERALGRLMGVAPQMVEDMQSLHARAKEAEKTPGGSLGTTEFATPLQRAAAR